MPKFKLKSSWYRREYLHYHAPDAVIARQASDYVSWLALERGWTTDEDTCARCHGAGDYLPSTSDMSPSNLRRWKRERRKAGKPYHYTIDEREPCPTCDSTGKVPHTERCDVCYGRKGDWKYGKTWAKSKFIPCAACKGEGALTASRLDTERAEQYIGEQRAQLERLALDACEEIERRLHQAGFRQVVINCHQQLPQTLAEYEEQAKAREDAERAASKAWDVARAAREAFEDEYATWSGERQCEYINGNERPAYREMEQLATELQSKLWLHGHVLHGLWREPGRNEIVHVGIRGPHRYHDAPKPDYSIVIKPGRAPHSLELDCITAEAIAATRGLDPLQYENEIALGLIADLDKPKPKRRRLVAPTNIFEFKGSASCCAAA